MLRFQNLENLYQTPNYKLSRSEEYALDQRIYWAKEHEKISLRVKNLKNKIKSIHRPHVQKKALMILKTYRYFSYLSYLAVLFWNNQ